MQMKNLIQFPFYFEIFLPVALELRNESQRDPCLSVKSVWLETSSILAFSELLELRLASEVSNLVRIGIMEALKLK